MLLDPEHARAGSSGAGGARAGSRRPPIQARASRVATRDRLAADGRRRRRGRRTSRRAPRPPRGGRKASARPAAAGAHPFSRGVGELNRTPRYAGIVREYGSIAARQLVCALQVHVAVGDSRPRAGHLQRAPRVPAASGRAGGQRAVLRREPTRGSRRCGRSCASSCRARGFRRRSRAGRSTRRCCSWGARAGAFPEARAWWWELRLHPRFGTLELRVPDAQSTVADAGAVAAVIHATRGLARRSARRRGAAGLAAALADRGKPLVGVPVRRAGHDGRSGHG